MCGLMKSICIAYAQRNIVDLGIFTLETSCEKNFRGVKFFAVLFDLCNFLTVYGCKVDERLESSWRLVYYQVQESQGSMAVFVDLTFTLGSMDLRTSLFIDHCCVILFFTC